MHDAGGLVWLPHPFRGHPDLGDLPYEVDIIEVFNARCSFTRNQRARDLCNEVDAIPAYGSDVHLARELGAMLVEYPAGETVIDTLGSRPSCLQPVRTDKSSVMAAEIINGVKTRGQPSIQSLASPGSRGGRESAGRGVPLPDERFFLLCFRRPGTGSSGSRCGETELLPSPPE